MWALGIILYQFFSNQLPFDDQYFEFDELKKLIKESEPPTLP